MTDWAWIYNIKAGDVLEAPSGMLRVVRRVQHSQTSRFPSICKTSVMFTIQRCSWTSRPYTVLTGNDLRQMGYRPVRARFRLNTEFDRQLSKDLDAPRAEMCGLHCCDVKGIA